MVQGDPGIGKSWLSLALASAISNGWDLPGGHPLRPAKSLFLSAEDDPSYTIRPRLDSLQADVGKVFLIRAAFNPDGSQRPVSLSDDLPRIEQYLETKGYDLLVVDPLNAYLGSVLDTHRDAAVRSVLAPLAALAERFGIAVICVQHLTKGGRERSIYRGQGSIAYVASARIVHLVGKDPDLLAPTPAGLAFDLGGTFQWAGESPFSAEELLKPDATPEERQDMTEAKEAIDSLLAVGEMEERKVFTQLRKRALKDGLIKRAKADLLRQGLISVVKGPADPDWIWNLVTPVMPPVNGHHPEQSDLGLQ